MRWAWLDRYLVTPAHGGAVQYLTRSLLAPHGRRERWRQAVARALTAAPGRLPESWLRATLGMAAGEIEAVPERFRASLEQWQALLAPAGEGLLAACGFPPGRPAGCVLLTNSADPRRGAQTVVFLFARGDSGPRAVVKLGSGEAVAREAVAREAAALDRLATLPGSLAATVPRKLATVELSAAGRPFTGLATSVLSGASAYVEAVRGIVWNPATAARHLELAARWLAAFHQATRAGRPWRPPPPQDRRLAAARDGRGRPPSWYRRLVRRLEAAPVASCAGHGDFWARNLLVPPDGDAALPGVVDWEGFRAAGAPGAGEPFDDLFHFPWTYAERWGRRRRWNGDAAPEPEQILERAFLAATPLAREVGRYFDLYLAHRGLPRRLLDPWLRLFLLSRAAGEGNPPKDDHPRKEALWLRAYRRYDRAPRSAFSG